MLNSAGLFRKTGNGLPVFWEPSEDINRTAWSLFLDSNRPLLLQFREPFPDRAFRYAKVIRQSSLQRPAEALKTSDVIQMEIEEPGTDRNRLAANNGLSCIKSQILVW